MYAIIRAGGKQAKVRSGDVIEVERVKNESETIEFRPLLVVDDDGSAHSDASVLDGAKVTAKVLGEVKGDKVDIFKYKNKSGYRRRMGHRQTYTQIEITDISFESGKKSQTKKSESKKSESKKSESKKSEKSEEAASTASSEEE